ncbi:MAG TPA: TetR/AcrR family transcriptional regulator, partial [Terriglobia bacterium]|nr:TetR/AcrR family transcriptional regulator [Terriglobia bacterium]
LFYERDHFMRITAEAKVATRERIVKAAAKLFRKNGWESTTTRGIAAAAGIATGTLFNYFESKEAIVAALIAEALERAEQEIRNRDESLEEELFTFIWTELASLRAYRKFLADAAESILSPLRRYARESAGDSIRANHLEAVEQILISRGVPGPLPAVTMQLYWTLYLGVFAHWATDDSANQEDTLALLDQSLKLFITSLPRPGDQHHEDESE